MKCGCPEPLAMPAVVVQWFDVRRYLELPMLAGEVAMSDPMRHVTWNLIKRPTDAGAHEPIEELTRVALSKPVETEDGVLPAGSVGTVVGIYRGGAAYEVEFAKPFHAVATVMPDAIRYARA